MKEAPWGCAQLWRQCAQQAEEELSCAAAASKAGPQGAPELGRFFRDVPKRKGGRGLGPHTDLLLKGGCSQGGEGPLDRAAPFS